MFGCEGASSFPAIIARVCHKHIMLSVRASRPYASFSSQSGSPLAFALCIGKHRLFTAGGDP